VAGSVGVADNRSGCGIPTKPAGGLLSNIGTGDPCLRLTGHAVPDRPNVFYVPPWAHTICPQANSGMTTISRLAAGVEPTPRGQEKGDEDNV